MKSVAAVYDRIERAALRHDRAPLYAWMARRTDNAVKEAIKHGLRMANDPDYRLGVEADRFAREYGEAFAESMGLGKQGDRRRALIEGALRLRAGLDTDARREGTRREVERLLGVMRAELDALRATPSDARRFPVQGFAQSTLDAEADGARDFPDDDMDEDDAAVRAVVRAYEAGGRAALLVSRADADTVIAGLTVLANTEDERAEAERKRPASKRDPEGARMARAASDGLTNLSTRIANAFRAPAPPPVAPVPVKASTLPGGFDSFDDEEEPPASWQHAARMALTVQMGEGEVTPVSSFLRDGETLLSVEPLAYRFSARVSVHELDRAVLLFAPTVRNEADAEKIVGAFRRKLVARTKATDAAWFAHLARIVIASPAGSWSFDAEPDPASAPRMRGEGDTVTAQKERLIVAAQRAFGRGVTITGNNEKGYTLHISPTTKKHKWGAASLRFGHDFDTAHAQLAEAIRRMNEAQAN